MRAQNASERLREIVRSNRRSHRGGVYAVCSAHPAVIHAAIHQAKDDGSLLLIESTSSQVNQLGGYTGQTPVNFAEFVHSAAKQAGLPDEQVLLGGDHLGPYPWRNENSESALQKATELVRACVLAGYKKIHLDASMACAGDGKAGLDEQTVAERAASLCAAAEKAAVGVSPDCAPLYVIGTEVPTPGGETLRGHAPAVTSAEQVARTVEAFCTAFEKYGLTSAWERVIGLVVQPGVEFDEDAIFNYDRRNTAGLSSALPQRPALVYEAHSTDFQPRAALAELVEDHFAILKVGPRLTFAFREAVFSLSMIERELLSQGKSRRLSEVREALDKAMLRNPTYWRSYYHGSEEGIRFARMYSYSDRCRYYWTDTEVQKELTLLYSNLANIAIPPALVSQYFPAHAEAARSGQQLNAESLIREHIRGVLGFYAAACSKG